MNSKIPTSYICKTNFFKNLFLFFDFVNHNLHIFFSVIVFIGLFISIAGILSTKFAVFFENIFVYVIDSLIAFSALYVFVYLIFYFYGKKEMPDKWYSDLNEQVNISKDELSHLCKKFYKRNSYKLTLYEAENFIQFLNWYPHKNIKEKL